jgi:hypothetical protein
VLGSGSFDAGVGFCAISAIISNSPCFRNKILFKIKKATLTLSEFQIFVALGRNSHRIESLLVQSCLSC